MFVDFKGRDQLLNCLNLVTFRLALYRLSNLLVVTLTVTTAHLERFWSLEDAQSKDIIFLHYYQNACIFQAPDGAHTRFPRKVNCSQLPTNFAIAM